LPSRLYNLTIEARDPAALAEFWRRVLDYHLAFSTPDEVAIEPQDDACPALIFVPVPHEKAGKNRLHLDLAPDDQSAEVERLLTLGARRLDVGQGDVPWVVMADPEGNEFCVLTPRDG
jgi:catechol 2,3-dioxygenase-like lactoylglutathione lyase family enzyme